MRQVSLGEIAHAFFKTLNGQWVHLIFDQFANDGGRCCVAPLRRMLGVGVYPDEFFKLLHKCIET